MLDRSTGNASSSNDEQGGNGGSHHTFLKLRHLEEVPTFRDVAATRPRNYKAILIAPGVQLKCFKLRNVDYNLPQHTTLTKLDTPSSSLFSL
jgi:hypothetical protein